MDERNVEHGTRLQYRLVRAVSRRTQLGCNLLLAAVLGCIGIAILAFAISHPHEENFWVPYTVGSGFTFAAGWRLLKTIRLAAAARVAETIVEVAVSALRRGESARFFFQQRGPLTLDSFRVYLVAAETVQTNAVRGIQWTTRPLARLNIVDKVDLEIPAATPMELFAALEVPADVDPTIDTGERRVAWTIEVEGKVRRGADFNNAFRIQVV